MTSSTAKEKVYKYTLVTQLKRLEVLVKFSVKMDWDSSLIQRSRFRQAWHQKEILPSINAMIEAKAEKKELQRHQKVLEGERDDQNLRLYKKEMACLVRRKREKALSVNQVNDEMITAKQERKRRAKVEDLRYKQHLDDLHEQYKQDLCDERERQAVHKIELRKSQLDGIQEKREAREMRLRLNELTELEAKQISKEKQQLADQMEREKKKRMENRIRHLESVGQYVAGNMRIAQERERIENERILQKAKEDEAKQLKLENDLREKQMAAVWSVKKINHSEIERKAKERERSKQLSYQETKRLLKESEEHLQDMTQQKRDRRERQRFVNEYNFKQVSHKCAEEATIKAEDKRFCQQVEKQLDQDKHLLLQRRIKLLERRGPDYQNISDPATESRGPIKGKVTKDTLFIKQSHENVNPLPLGSRFPCIYPRKETQDKIPLLEKRHRKAEDISFPKARNFGVLENQNTHMASPKTLPKTHFLPSLTKHTAQNKGQLHATYWGTASHFCPQPPSHTEVFTCVAAFRQKRIIKK